MATRVTQRLRVKKLGGYFEKGSVSDRSERTQYRLDVAT